MQQAKEYLFRLNIIYSIIMFDGADKSEDTYNLKVSELLKEYCRDLSGKWLVRKFILIKNARHFLTMSRF